MGAPLYDRDEGLWDLYINDCRNKGLRPNIKDFLIWKDEEGYEEDEQPEYWDREMTDVA